MPVGRRFYQVDVFSTDPTLGNGLAVVRDGGHAGHKVHGYGLHAFCWWFVWFEGAWRR